MIVLNVAEKNDAAKGIAHLLSRGSSIKKEGRSKFNKIYEFDYRIDNFDCRMLMTSVSGHMLNLEFGFDKKNWNNVNPADLFDSPVFKSCSKETENVKRSLEELSRTVQKLIIWTDCDREGENIGMEIVQVCTKVNRNLNIKRAKFSEITFQSVTRAIQNLGNVDELQSIAVDVRQELDLKTGAAFTRLQTMYLRNSFPQSLSDKLVSYGSCQFPTMGFVVDRFKTIENFQSEPFWKINLSHKKQLNSEEIVTTEFTWDRGKLFNLIATQALYDNIVSNQGSLACVIDVTKNPKSKWRPIAMDTVELEKLASRKLKINAKETMSIAEKLYSRGYISYPRTETNIFPKELNLLNLVQVQIEDQRWADFASQIVAQGVNPHNGKKTDQAHPPIHPLKCCGKELGGNEARIFELVTRHFLACLSSNAQGNETRVVLECVDAACHSAQIWLDNTQLQASGHGEIFYVKGLTIIQRNYLLVYPYDKWSDKELPEYKPREVLQSSQLSVEMNQGSTSAPNLLTEADLITLMEKHGIGTDATHADHIDRVKSRQYVGCTGNNNQYLIPGQLGMGLVDAYQLMGFCLDQPGLRAEFERDLDLICRGQKQSNEVLQYYLTKYKEIFIQVQQQVSKLNEGLSRYLQETPTASVNNRSSGGNSNIAVATGLPTVVRACPTCSGDSPGSISIRSTRADANNPSKWFLGCSAFPGCKHSIWLCNTQYTVERVTIATEPDNPLVPIECTSGFHSNTHSLPVYLVNIKLADGPPLIGDVLRKNDGSYNVCLYCNQSVLNFLQIQTPNTSSNSRNLPINNTPSSAGPNKFINPSSLNQSTSLNITPTLAVNHSSDQDDGAPLCLCSQPTVRKKVIKEGPNKGRYFYSCHSGSCKYFLWSEDNNPQASTGPTGPSNFRSNSYNSNNNNTSNNSFKSTATSDVNCNCNTPATLFTVHKNTANKGRQFYSCKTCNFFQWADENTSGRGEGGSAGGSFVGANKKYSKSNSIKGSSFLASNESSGNKRSYSSTENMWPPVSKQSKLVMGNVGQTTSIRKCSICRMSGHTAKKCPNQ